MTLKMVALNVSANNLGRGLASRRGGITFMLVPVVQKVVNSDN